MVLLHCETDLVAHQLFRQQVTGNGATAGGDYPSQKSILPKYENFLEIISLPFISSSTKSGLFSQALNFMTETRTKAPITIRVVIIVPSVCL